MQDCQGYPLQAGCRVRVDQPERTYQGMTLPAKRWWGFIQSLDESTEGVLVQRQGYGTHTVPARHCTTLRVSDEQRGQRDREESDLALASSRLRRKRVSSPRARRN